MNLLEDLQDIYENPDKPLKLLSKAGLRYELFVAALHDEVIDAWKKYDGHVGVSEKFQALEDVEKTLIAQMAKSARPVRKAAPRRTLRKALKHRPTRQVCNWQSRLLGNNYSCQLHTLARTLCEIFCRLSVL